MSLSGITFGFQHSPFPSAVTFSLHDQLLFDSLVLSLFPSHLILLGWKNKYSWFQEKGSLLLYRILPLSNDCITFLINTRQSLACYRNADSPELVVIFISLASMPTSSYLFLWRRQMNHAFLWSCHCPAFCTTWPANTKTVWIFCSYWSQGVSN